MESLATADVPVAQAIISWTEDKDQTLLSLLKDNLDYLQLAFPSTRQDTLRGPERDETVLRLCIELFEKEDLSWIEDMELRGLIKRDRRGKWRPTSRWRACKYSSGAPPIGRIKRLKAKHLHYSQQEGMKERWTEWAQVERHDEKLCRKLKAAIPYYFTISRLIRLSEKVISSTSSQGNHSSRSLAKSRSSAVSTRSAGGATVGEAASSEPASTRSRSQKRRISTSSQHDSGNIPAKARALLNSTTSQTSEQRPIAGRPMLASGQSNECPASPESPYTPLADLPVFSSPRPNPLGKGTHNPGFSADIHRDKKRKTMPFMPQVRTPPPTPHPTSPSSHTAPPSVQGVEHIPPPISNTSHTASHQTRQRASLTVEIPARRPRPGDVGVPRHPAPTPQSSEHDEVPAIGASLPDVSCTLDAHAPSLEVIDWTEPRYTSALVASLHIHPRTRAILLPDRRPPVEGVTSKDEWKLLRNLYVDIMAAEPGQAWLNLARTWKWAWPKKDASSGWKATVLWPKEAEYGFVERLKELEDLWHSGELELNDGHVSGSKEGPSWSDMLAGLFGPSRRASHPSNPPPSPSLAFSSSASSPSAPSPLIGTGMIPPAPILQDAQPVQALPTDAPFATPVSIKWRSDTWRRPPPSSFKEFDDLPGTATGSEPTAPAASVDVPRPIDVPGDDDNPIFRPRALTRKKRFPLPPRPPTRESPPPPPRTIRRASPPRDTPQARPPLLRHECLEMMELASNPYLLVEDLPHRWQKGFEKACDQKELLAFGGAELYMRGLMELVKLRRELKVYRTYHKVAFDTELLPSQYIVNLLCDTLLITGGQRLPPIEIDDWVDPRRPLQHPPRDHRFRIHLFGDEHYPLETQVLAGTTRVHDVGLLEYLVYAAREFIW